MELAPGGHCHGYASMVILVLIGRRVSPEAEATTTGDGSVLPREYCLSELFEASCEKDHVILVHLARYGRMRLGHCARTDFGFVGCYADVINIVDMRCSGRPECSFRVPDPLFEKLSGLRCNREFKLYLEASYTCIPVSTAKTPQCVTAKHLKLIAPSGYIPNLVTEETGVCGTEAVPWFIEVEPGKKILLTLYDFGLVDPHQEVIIPVAPNRGCVHYADVVEGAGGNQRNSKVCGGRGRVVEVYTSSSRAVEVRVVKQKLQKQLQQQAGRRKNQEYDSNVYFIIHYQAIGCADPELPPGVWIKRTGETATVGCDFNDWNWKLQCSKNEWIGSTGNCSQGALSSGSPQGLDSGGLLSLPFEVSLAIIIGLAFVVGVTVFTLGVILLKRSTFIDQSSAVQRVAMTDHPRGSTLTSPSKYGRALLDSDRLQLPGTCQTAESDYAYVWDNPTESPDRREESRTRSSDPTLHYLHPMCQVVTRLPPGGVYETAVSHPDRTAHNKFDIVDDTRGLNRMEHLA